MASSYERSADVSALMQKAREADFSDKRAEAIALYSEALALIPEPKEDWHDTMIICATIGELYFLDRKMDLSFDYYSRALRSKGGADGWSTRFRLGQIYYDRGEMDRAKEEFLRVYLDSEGRGFEDEDPKYFDLIKDEPGVEPPALPANWPERLWGLIETARQIEEEGEFEVAVGVYRRALNMMPEPKEEFEEATEIYSAIGEFHFLNSEPEQAFENFNAAVRSPGGLGTPHIHLRLGQLRYERGEMERARDELMRAYMGEGMGIFENEDAKYYNLIRDVVEAERP